MPHEIKVTPQEERKKERKKTHKSTKIRITQKIVSFREQFSNMVRDTPNKISIIG